MSTIDHAGHPDIHESLRKFVATRDARIAKTQPWSTTPLADYLHVLLAKGVVRVGGRATCGTYTDPTWKIFGAWNEVVRKARKLGYAISETDIPQPNAWATKAGGFWNESEYRIEVRNAA